MRPFHHSSGVFQYRDCGFASRSSEDLPKASLAGVSRSGARSNKAEHCNRWCFELDPTKLSAYFGFFMSMPMVKIMQHTSDKLRHWDDSLELGMTDHDAREDKVRETQFISLVSPSIYPNAYWPANELSFSSNLHQY